MLICSVNKQTNKQTNKHTDKQIDMPDKEYNRQEPQTILNLYFKLTEKIN